jgi:hypothetical protein
MSDDDLIRRISNTLQGFGDGVQIPHSIINDGYGGHVAAG